MQVDLDRPMAEIRARSRHYPVKTRLPDGTMVVARDIAHAKLKERLDRGEALPDYIKDHPVYYAGPAKTPGATPPATSGRPRRGGWTATSPISRAAGGSLSDAGEGQPLPRGARRLPAHGGFYLGSVGGPAARLAQDCIRRVEVLEYPELGMEAVWRIEVEDFPAFVVIDDKGHDFLRGARLMLFTVDRLDHVV